MNRTGSSVATSNIKVRSMITKHCHYRRNK
jgi:hypothetical protein